MCLLSSYINSPLKRGLGVFVSDRRERNEQSESFLVEPLLRWQSHPMTTHYETGNAIPLTARSPSQSIDD